jgi:hypothetical protein
MPFLFQTEFKPESSASGFIVAKPPTTYGPGMVILTIILGIILAVYAVIFSMKTKVESDVSLVRMQIEDLERSRDPVIEAQILTFEKQVSALSDILGSHVYMSQLFPILNDVTPPSVTYDSIAVALEKESVSAAASASNTDMVKVRVSGKVPTLLDLARLMVAFKSDPRMKAQVDSYTLNEMKDITFTATMVFENKIVHSQKFR